MIPSWAKLAPSWSQVGPKLASSWPQVGPWGQSWSHHGPKIHSQDPQKTPRTPKALSRDPQGTSRGPSRDPKMQIFHNFVMFFKCNFWAKVTSNLDAKDDVSDLLWTWDMINKSFWASKPLALQASNRQSPIANRLGGNREAKTITSKKTLKE